MESIIHADIFFFITTIVTLILAVLLIIVLIYLIKIMADIRDISRMARNETEAITSDIHEIRQEVSSELKRGSSIVVSLVRVIQSLFRRRQSRHYKK